MAKKIKKKEKIIKIGKFRIKSDKLCIISMVLILVVSSVGFIGIGLISTPEEERQQQWQAQVVITFSNETRVTEIVYIEPGETAEQAFRKVANLTTEFAGGVRVVEVSHGDTIKTRDGNMTWTFYINGRFTLTQINLYQLRHADTIELRFEEPI